MIAEEKSSEYDYYPEAIARIVIQHELISPEEEREFVQYVRGC